jgi:hypothetical protein
MARKNPMAVKCPECGGSNIRMSRWRNPFEQFLDLIGMPPMRCLDCDHRWRHSLWRLREIFNARCPRCYRLQLVHWEETYYHIPKWWQFCIALGAKKVRCKACRHNFVSFRRVRGIRKWINVAPTEKPVVESTITLEREDSA